MVNLSKEKIVLKFIDTLPGLLGGLSYDTLMEGLDKELEDGVGEEGAATLEKFREEMVGLEECLKKTSKSLYGLLDPLLLKSMKYLHTREQNECKLMDDAVAQVLCSRSCSVLFYLFIYFNFFS